MVSCDQDLVLAELDKAIPGAGAPAGAIPMGKAIRSFKRRLKWQRVRKMMSRLTRSLRALWTRRLPSAGG